MPRVNSRLFTRKESALMPRRNISADAAVASSKSIALRRFAGTETAHSRSAATKARRFPLRSPQAVTRRSKPERSVKVRLVSMTSVGTSRRSVSSRSGGCDRSAERRLMTPWVATAKARRYLRQVFRVGPKEGRRAGLWRLRGPYSLTRYSSGRICRDCIL